MKRLFLSIFAVGLSVTGAYAQCTCPPVVQPDPIVIAPPAVGNPGEVIRIPNPANQATVAKLISEADRLFETQPDTRFVIQLPAGRVDLTGSTNSGGSFQIDNVDPGQNGRLIIRGAGKYETTVVQDHVLVGISSRNSERITFEDLTLTTPKPKVTQGHIVRIAGNVIWLKILARIS